VSGIHLIIMAITSRNM